MGRLLKSQLRIYMREYQTLQDLHAVLVPKLHVSTFLDQEFTQVQFTGECSILKQCQTL
jgi:hypothetical protein